MTSQVMAKTSTDLLDGRGGDRGAGTPVFFNSSNLMIGGGATSNGLYSQLTNATSSSALNTIPQTTGFSNLNPNSNSSANTTAASSPINLQQTQPATAVNSLIQSEVMKRSDSKGLNIFNVDFLGRNKNKEKKAAQKAAAAAAAAANSPNTVPDVAQTQTSTLSKSKFSRGIKKKNPPTSASGSNSQQYETFNTTITSNSSSLFNTNNVGLSVSNNSNRDSSSINSEDSNDHKTTNMNANSLTSDNLNGSPLISTKKSSDMSGAVITSSNQNTNNHHHYNQNKYVAAVF